MAVRTHVVPILALVGMLLAGCTSSPDGAAPGPWTVADRVRWAELPASPAAGPGFRQLDSTETGVGFVNTLAQDQFLSNRHYVNGSGVSVGDVNGDAWPDLYFAHLSGPNELYLNQGGFRFEKVPEAGGAALQGEFSSGTALADLDGDRDLDLIVTTMGGPNVVFHNDGTGRFERVADAGLRTGEGSSTVALSDVDGDGDLDLYVGNYKKETVKDLYAADEIRFERVVVQRDGEYRVRDEFQDHYEVRRQANRIMRFEYAEPDRFYLNDGDGTFTEQAWGDVFRTADGAPMTEVPLDWTLVARFEDLNGDGQADLYLCNDFESPDRLFLAQGDGTFRASDETTIRATSHSTMSIATSDVDRDGDKDFFLADMLGQTYEARKTQTASRSPVPVSVGAARQRTQEMQNTLQLNRGDGTFVEIAEIAGIEATGWTWSSRFLDVDLDGYDDLIITNGHAYDAMHADTQMRLSNTRRRQAGRWRTKLLEYPDLDLKSAAFRNRGDGTFEAMPDGWGLGTEADVGHGMATADIDRDGDLDVVVNRLSASAGVYRNLGDAPRVAVRLVGAAPNTQAIGAHVRVTPRQPNGDAGAVPPAQTQSVTAGGEYLSHSTAEMTFAMGAAERATVAVTWPDGDTSRVAVQTGRIYEIAEPGAEVDWEAAPSDTTEASPSAAAEPPSSGLFLTAAHAAPPERPAGPVAPMPAPADTGRWFEDISDRLDHTHPETKYEDFQRQPLMPRRLSQQGPGVAWADLDADGDDDLLIGAGRGGSMAYYRNDDGQLTRIRGGVLDQTFERDLTGIVAAPHADGATVFVGYSNYERTPRDPARPSSIFVYESSATGLRRTDSLTFGPSSVGPLALADVDLDGDLDLFAGGRHEPGAYPADASSVVFVNNDGRYERSRRLSRPFNDLGMVSAAAFADMDADGDPDLLLATEWGPVHYFENQGGQFIVQTEARGLAAHTGFWNGIDVGDVNGDGRLDLVATNWGWNSKYGRPPGPVRSIDAAGLERPLRVYYADFDRNGSMDLLETQYHEERDEYLPYEGLSTMAQAMPFVRRRFSSFEDFSTASLKDIVGPSRFQSAETKEVNTVSHMVFLNTAGTNGPRFEGRLLPMWAQLTTGFSPSLADANGDGHLDILMSQNFFATQIQTPRQDGGRALVLRGDGTGAFTPVKGHHSGLLVYGEQRAAPVADIDQDGRIDVLVTQNGAETKLFRNVGATPGLRVRLDGPDDNPSGIGATLRARYADGSRGPAVPVTAGSGYWSQHSAVRVLGHGNGTIAAVEVRWPDGTTTEQDVADGARSTVVAYP